MPNPFVAKAKKSKQNPFAAKAKKSIVTTQAAKRNGNNPFSTRAKDGRAQRIAELDQMIIEAETRYEESLAKALKGISRAQTNQRFNVSDRHMHTLLNLTRQRKRVVEGTEIASTSWGSSKPKKKKRTETQKPEKKSPSPGKIKSSSSKSHVPKKEPGRVTIRLATGSAPRI